MLAVASILSITVTSAQISVGAGYLYQSLGEKTAGDYVASHINFDGFYVGADFGIKCGKIFSVVPGIYIARHYRIMLGYDYGLLNRAKNMDSNVAHNQQFNIGVAYVF